MNNIIPGRRFSCIMKEFDDTSAEETPTIDEMVASLARRVRELEAMVEDLHSDRAQRLQQIDLEDPEWY